MQTVCSVIKEKAPPREYGDDIAKYHQRICYMHSALTNEVHQQTTASYLSRRLDLLKERLPRSRCVVLPSHSAVGNLPALLLAPSTPGSFARILEPESEISSWVATVSWWLQGAVNTSDIETQRFKYTLITNGRNKRRTQQKTKTQNHRIKGYMNLRYRSA